MPNLFPTKDVGFLPSEGIGTLLANGAPQWLALPIAFGTADAATLFTVPAGMRMFIHRACWEVAVSFTGGASSAIGVSSDATGYSTKGDILGGASGDVAATLVAATNPAGGTVGAKFGSNGVIVIPATKIVRFDRITSAFTAGSGYVHLHVSMMPTS